MKSSYKNKKDLPSTTFVHFFVYKSGAGFTLIEILVVIGIFGMILAFGLVTNLGSFKRNTFQAEQSILVSILERARARSMNNIYGMAHGVCYIAPNYVVFRGRTACLPTSSNDETVSANENISSLSGFSDPAKFPTIVFEQLSGKAMNASISMTDGIKSGDITINNEGRIDW